MIALAVAMASSVASAAPNAADLLKQGAEAFKGGKYEEAIALLTKAYELEPKPDTLFALAQAERLGGHCDKAIVHYKQVLEKMTDLEKSKLVQSNLALCENTQKPEPPPTPPPVRVDPTPPPAPPPAVTKTVVRVERSSDKLATTSFAFGALGIGAGIGLWLSSSASRDDAAHARTLEDNRAFNDRADLHKGLSIAAFGVGAGLVGFAVYRWVTAKDAESSSTVSIVPTTGGATASVFARW